MKFWGYLLVLYGLVLFEGLPAPVLKKEIAGSFARPLKILSRTPDKSDEVPV